MKTYQQYADDAWPGLKAQARKRKRLNQIKLAAFIIAPIAIGAFLSLSSTTRPDPPLAKIDPPALPPGAPSQGLMLSEEEALEKLADLGPILLQLADGSKQIILTRPNNLSPPTLKPF